MTRFFFAIPNAAPARRRRNGLTQTEFRNIKDDKPTEAELRPMLIADDFVLVGFKEPEWAKTVK